MSGHPQDGAKGLGRYGLGQCQDCGSARVWPAAGEAPGASQAGRSRHWLKLDEAGASAPPHQIQITGTLSSSMVLVSSAPPSLPPLLLSSSNSSSPSSMSSSLPASEGV